MRGERSREATERSREKKLEKSERQRAVRQSGKAGSGEAEAEDSVRAEEG